ncbi:proline dehydrogenase family protein [Candidatus Neomarinimicrobiota bacterium]
MLNNLLAFSLPVLPKVFVGLVAKRYVAGETKEQALATVKSLNGKGFEATLDILGEHVTSREEAGKIADAYIDLFHEISDHRLQSNISLKPTHLGLDLEYSICEQNLFRILDTAAETGNFLRIDMEDSPHTDDTLMLFRKCVQRYNAVGPVLQAYMHRSSNDLNQLSQSPLNFRLCKGIYREPLDIAIQDRAAINDNFISLLQQAFNADTYVAIATHDRDLIDRALVLIKQLNIPSSRFEFQVLYGVPMNGKLAALLAEGFKVRIYVPFGEAWYDYSLRRLKENPNLAGYVLHNLFRKRY